MVELLTEAQAAERAGVSKWTIRRLIDAGKLRAVNYGLGAGAIFFRRARGNVPRMYVLSRPASRCPIIRLAALSSAQ